MGMKVSNLLNIISAILTLVFIIFLINNSYQRGCFSWLDYWVAFGTLFTNLGISIIASLEK